MKAFDLLGELPRGTTVLEASAGTGKTHTIAALVARYVIEGEALLEEMLVITFGRAASEELKERVRSYLRQAELALEDPGSAAANADPLLASLVDVEESELALRRRRLADAMATFDSATIATTHTFCQTVLRSLGVVGDTDRSATLVEDLSDLTGEVVDDIYLARFADEASPLLRHSEARALCAAVVEDSQAALVASDDPLSQARLDFATRVRAEVEVRKRRGGLLSFDDLLSQLADALEAADAPARQRMRDRWKIVLVDEFQDTDPVQWKVLERAFHGHATLVLIGDPKQAIYAFRGGDIYTYLRAIDRADQRLTLPTNWRSDAPLVDALQALLHGAELGSPEIAVHRVAAQQTGSRLSQLPHPAPVRLRYVEAPDDKLAPIGRVREKIAPDLAADIANVLTSGAEFQGRRVKASDMAVISFSLKHAELFAAALREVGVASVVHGGQSVLSSSAALDWVCLLEAISRPQHSRRVRAAALTSLLGYTPQQIVDGGEELTDELAEQLRGWQDLLRRRGVAAVYEAVSSRGLAARLLSQPNGERIYTDLNHLAQILQQAWHLDGLGLAGLLRWLREERDAATQHHERTRRLDTDQDAVQLLTIHASKGLQYPIVYLPFAFDTWVNDRELTTLFHQGADHTRTRDVSATGMPSGAASERAGEELRVAYVAMTRAQSQVIAWYSRTTNSANSGLSRLLFGRGENEGKVPDRWAAPLTDAEAITRLRQWEQAGALTLERVLPVDATRVTEAETDDPLSVRIWNREVDTEWRRTSYSGLIRAEEQAATSEREDLGTDDEATIEAEALEGTPEEAPQQAVVDDGERSPAEALPDDLPSPMNELPAGATFGSLVHAVLEHADPQADDFGAELRRCVTEQQRWWAVETDDAELAEALIPMNQTPLGPLVDDRDLLSFPMSDRLRELDFEIPLAGGDQGSDVEVLVRQIGDLIRRHLPDDDPMRRYAERLDNPSLGEQHLRGYLSGSIDVVLRVGDPERYVVVDYKTNRLGEPDVELSALDYTQQQMTEAMLHSHYPLQALLYSAVLHRYLRWRLPHYDPVEHLGGIVYLYVRGMCGPQTPVVDGIPCGVFTWKPPVELVTELSDLLAGELR